MSNETEEREAVEIARANLPDFVLAEIETLQADLEHERECTAQLFGLNCQLAARLADLRLEVSRLKAQLKKTQSGTDYLLWI